MIPLGGSAYTYSFAAGGELFAWLVGWALILSYGIGNAALASSFSDNLTGLVGTLSGYQMPAEWSATPGGGGVFDVPAFVVVMLITLLLLRPTRESATANAALVAVKVGVLLLFLAVAIPRGDAANLTPFAPFGATGVFAGAALIFFAFLGFDAISTAAEETRDPQKDLPRGIIGSLVVVTVLFVAIGLALTALTPYGTLNNGEPLAVALRAAGLPGLSAVMNVGGLLAALSVLLVFQLATVRVFLALSRDGLVPRRLAALHPRHQTPNRLTLLLGFFVALFAAFVPLGILVAVTNLATLFIFGAAMLALLLLRRAAPDVPRPFRCPWVPAVPALGILACAALSVFTVLAEPITGLGFLAWMGFGLMVYAAYGARHSVLRKADAAIGTAPAPGEPTPPPLDA
jgi:APA family basic amino acid/polyamine antiporter